MKNTTETFEIDGLKVELKRVPIRRHDWSMGAKDADGNPLGHPIDRTRYSITIDGVLVGHCARPAGWGKQEFAIERLGKAFDDGYYGTKVSGLAGFGEGKLYTTEEVARRAVALRRGGKLQTEPEREVYLADLAEQKRKKEAEDQANRERWKREREEKDRAAEERRLEILGGLQSIEERLTGQLTNFERNALVAAIAWASKK